MKCAGGLGFIANKSTLEPIQWHFAISIAYFQRMKNSIEMIPFLYSRYLCPIIIHSKTNYAHYFTSASLFFFSEMMCGIGFKPNLKSYYNL